MKGEQTYRVPIKKLPPSTRPRERLWREGASALSEVELLAIILRTGSARGSALDLARFLLSNFGGLKGLATAAVQELSSVPGMGEAKAAQVAAALELGRRLGTLEVSSRPVINSPAAAAQLVVPTMAHLEQEEFRVILLDTKNQLLGIETVAVGGLNIAGVLPREVFRAAVRRSACALILAHNHPSGDPTPSGEDLALTRRLVQAGDLLGVEVLDHLIIGDNCYVSLKEANLW
ncbi:RadC family protein [Ammonifex thiophilus]|uniref:JAB domain-containing protein n=1 Tax=Ammonifex thiophilus TaxID=444093 RepID=A0A3D8P2Z1_9THEO|nr:DNA repair protein RadC [Ammonifex thiophilus]RDV82925.1 JAB domain-containing protein [Ammonifex thiophilus]